MPDSRSLLTANPRRPALAGPARDGAWGAYLDQRLAAKADLDRRTPHPLQPALFTPVRTSRPGMPASGVTARS